jgi:hypothetical protein
MEEQHKGFLKYKIVRIIIGIPNLPVILLIAIYGMIMMIKNTGLIEMQLKKDRDGFLLTDEIKNYLTQIYPLHLRIFIAVCVYRYIILRTI